MRESGGNQDDPDRPDRLRFLYDELFIQRDAGDIQRAVATFGKLTRQAQRRRFAIQQLLLVAFQTPHDFVM